MKTTACPVCGSLDMGMPGIGDGAVPGGGELMFMVCRDCNYRGPPLEIDPAHHDDLVAALAGRHGAQGTQDVAGATQDQPDGPGLHPQALDAVSPGQRGPQAFPRTPGSPVLRERELEDDPVLDRPAALPLSGGIIIVLGLMLTAFSGLVAAAQSLAALAGAYNVPILLAALFGIAVGVAVVRIGLRMARGHA